MFPIINRGTWTRVFSVRSVILKFLTAYKDQPVQIISLGSGYDTAYFWLKDLISSGALPESLKLTYVEVDYHDVIENKIAIIKKHENLLKHIDGEISNEQSINTESFKMIPGDLRKTSEIGSKMNGMGVHREIPTLVITECVLVYLKPEDT